jgi:hypothetical protein
MKQEKITMIKRILKVNGEPMKTNSSFGNYAVPCTFEFTYNSGINKIMDGEEMFWTAKKAREFYKHYTLKAVTA